MITINLQKLVSIMRNKWIESLVSCLIAGLVIAVFVGIFIMLSYVFLWGLLVGVVLWAIISIKEAIFPSEVQRDTDDGKSEGRVIDYDDIK